DAFAGLQRPQARRPVFTARGRDLAVGTDRHLEHRPLMLAQELAGGLSAVRVRQLPQAHSAMSAAPEIPLTDRDHGSAVVIDGQARDVRMMKALAQWPEALGVEGLELGLLSPFQEKHLAVTAEDHVEGLAPERAAEHSPSGTVEHADARSGDRQFL